MNRIRFQKTPLRSKHNTKGCWVFPDGVIFKNPTVLDKAKKKEIIAALKAKGAQFFSSVFEAKVYHDRKWEFKAEHIQDFKRGVQLELKAITGKVVTKFKTDFTYFRDGKFVVEDAKGSEFQCTPDWKLKWAWAQAQHPDWLFLITYQKAPQPKKSKKP